MSRTSKITLALALVATAQVSALGGYLYSQTRAAPPALVSFDATRSLTMFVMWSADRFADEGFDKAIARFETRVSDEVAALSASQGALVLRQDAILTPNAAPLVDITDQIMRKVLDDATF